jgi:pimeloyl-ACP methyl ester carboxylesterase
MNPFAVMQPFGRCSVKSLSMMSSAKLVLGLVLAGCSAQQAPAAAGTTVASKSVSQPSEKGHVEVNGIRLYYELHGPAGGVPLVLLNGGGSTIEVTYGQILPYLAQHRRVIALDEQNHGRSGHRRVPERFSDSARDVAELLRQLKIEQADVMGFSNGASVAMHVALLHRGLVRKLIFAGSMTKKSGAPAQFWEQMAKGTYADMPQELKAAFLAVNPDQAQLHDMYDKDSERMRNFVETSDDEVRSLNIPTLIIAGDRDVSTPEHAVELARLLPQARLLILPGTHGAFLGEELNKDRGAREPETSAQLIENFLEDRY